MFYNDVQREMKEAKLLNSSFWWWETNSQMLERVNGHQTRVVSLRIQAYKMVISSGKAFLCNEVIANTKSELLHRAPGSLKHNKSE